jgi:DNA-binding CsgD family transcriptional regulator
MPSPNSRVLPHLIVAILSRAGDEATAAACIVEPDPLLRFLAEEAARGLGFGTHGDGRAHRATVTFRGLDTFTACPRLLPPAVRLPESPEHTRRPEHPVIGYVGGAPVLLAAHKRHGCTDGVVRLCAIGGRASFVCEPDTAADELERTRDDGILPPDVTARETDVLLLVLAGFTTPEIAARLSVSQATARSHCRSLLRKCGAPDRRQLRAHFLGGCSRLPHV